jgi:hypothetical protein
MIEPGSDLRLPRETSERCWIDATAHRLEGEALPIVEPFDFLHGAHPTRAESPQYGVAPVDRAASRDGLCGLVREPNRASARSRERSAT